MRKSRTLLLVLGLLAVLSVAAPSGSLWAHDCSSPADCEQTAGYNAILAIVGGIMGILASLLGPLLSSQSGVVPQVTTGTGPTPVSPTPAPATPAPSPQPSPAPTAAPTPSPSPAASPGPSPSPTPTPPPGPTKTNILQGDEALDYLVKEGFINQVGTDPKTGQPIYKPYKPDFQPVGPLKTVAYKLDENGNLLPGSLDHKNIVIVVDQPAATPQPPPTLPPTPAPTASPAATPPPGTPTPSPSPTPTASPAPTPSPTPSPSPSPSPTPTPSPHQHKWLFEDPKFMDNPAMMDAIKSLLDAEFSGKVREMIVNGYFTRNYDNWEAMKNWAQSGGQGGRCEDFQAWGLAATKELLAKEFPEMDVILDTLTIQPASSTEEEGYLDGIFQKWDTNHIAPRIILPNGERVILDYWEGVGSGLGTVMTEQEWIDKWTTTINEPVYVTRSDEEQTLEKYKDLYGDQKGAEKWEQEMKNKGKSGDLFIKSNEKDTWIK